MASSGNAEERGVDVRSAEARQQGMQVVREVRQVLAVREVTGPANPGGSEQLTGLERSSLGDQPQSSNLAVTAGNRRRRLSREESDVEELRRALEETHAREEQWERVVQQQVTEFAQHERHEAQVASGFSDTLEGRRLKPSSDKRTRE